MACPQNKKEVTALNSRIESLQNQLATLKQQAEFTTYELNEYKDREAKLKRANETLLKAMTEGKPPSSLMAEFKVMIQRYGGSDRQKQLQKQLETLRNERDREVQLRVKAILQDSEFKSSDKQCPRCKLLDDQNSNLNAEFSKLEIKFKAQQEEIKRLTADLSAKIEQIGFKEKKIADLDQQSKRQQDNYQREIERLREFKKKQQEFIDVERMNRIENEWRERLKKIQESKERDIEELKSQIQDGYQQLLDNQLIKIEGRYEEQIQFQKQEYQAQLQLMKENYEHELQMTKETFEMRRMGGFAKKDSSVDQPSRWGGGKSPLKPTRLPLDPVAESGYCRQAYSRMVDEPDENRYALNKKSQMKGEIKGIINDLTKRTSNGGSNTSIMNATTMNQMNMSNLINEPSEYCNFSIKDSINRPNNLLASHLKLKKRAQGYM